MQFSTQDQDLVEIMEAVGEAAIDSHSGRLTAKEEEEKAWYIDLLVKRYIRGYDHNIPGRAYIAEALNWYVGETFHDASCNLAKTIKGIMRNLVFKPYERYRKQYNNGNLNPAPGRG